eukprot:GHVS01097911.1.p1 GENE.GHVS01097911.1~~GHVS01097911.1.p1  ORF type:complete len:631 (+),score=138.44 GHVS01097911.1:248-2140(+)
MLPPQSLGGTISRPAAATSMVSSADPVERHGEGEGGREERMDVFDGADQESGSSLSQNPRAIKRLFKALKENEVHSSRTLPSRSQDIVVSSRQSATTIRPVWLVLSLLAVLLLLLCSIGTIIALVYLGRNEQSKNAPTGSLYTGGQEGQMPFSPLPLLWALPMQYFQEVSSVLLRMSPSHEDMYKVNAISRDTERNITRLVLATNHQLIVSPDVAVLQDPSVPLGSSGGILARWNFNILWSELYEEQYGQTLGDDITSTDRFNELIAELLVPYQQPPPSPSSTNSPSSSSSQLTSTPIISPSSPHLWPTTNIPDYSATSGSSLLTEQPSHPPSSSSPDVSPTIIAPALGSFPLLRRPLPSSPSGSFRPPPSTEEPLLPATPTSAMSLPASVVSAEESLAAGEAMEVLNGFPEPPVDEEEPIQFSRSSDGRAERGEQEVVAVGSLPTVVIEDGGELLLPEEQLRLTDGIVATEREAVGNAVPSRAPLNSVLGEAAEGGDGGGRAVEELSRRERRSGGVGPGSGSDRRLLAVVDDLFRFKMNLVAGSLDKLASKADKLAGLGGAFLTPAVNWSMSNPFSTLSSPLIAPFAYYGSGGSGSYWNFPGYNQPPLQHSYMPAGRGMGMFNSGLLGG